MRRAFVSTQQPAKGPAILALLVLALIWGYNWVVMKIGVQYAPAFDFAAIRALFGAISLFLVMIWLHKPLAPQEIPKTLLLGVLQTGGMIGFSTWALVSGGAGKTSVLVYAMPFWVLLFAWLLLKERLHRSQWLCVGLALAGLLLILTPLNLTSGMTSKGLAIMAGISWALSAVLTKVLQRQIAIDLLSLTAWQMLFGSLPLLGVALLLPSPPIQWSGAFIAALLYNIVPGTAIAYLLWFYALSRLPAGIASLGTLANPLIGVLAAWIQLGERPELTESIGILLIIAALAFNALQALKSQPA